MIETLGGTFLASTLLFSTPQTQLPHWSITTKANDHIFNCTKQSLVCVFQHQSLTNSLLYEPATEVESDARGKLLERLASWKTLPAGWDGEHSEAPNHDALSLTAKFINLLPSDILLPKPMLSSSGEVGLYWDIPTTYIDLEFASGTNFSAYFRDRLTDKERFIENLSMSMHDLNLLFLDLGSSYQLSA